MDALRKLQQEFLGHLLDNTTIDIVEKIQSNPMRSAERRMSLYGTAYVLRLKEALSTDYERLHSYLGDEMFDTLMQHYITRYPSHGPNLRYFSQHMIELVDSLEPFNQFLEVGEITRIEQAFANSFDAADREPVTLDDLAQLDPESWATLTPVFHPAVQLLPQRYNSFQIWQALADEQVPPEKSEDETTWLIWREDLVSHYRALEDAELAALTVAMQGKDFSDLCLALLPHFDEQETPQRAVGFLQQWISNQMLCQLR